MKLRTLSLFLSVLFICNSLVLTDDVVKHVEIKDESTIEQMQTEGNQFRSAGHQTSIDVSDLQNKIVCMEDNTGLNCSYTGEPLVDRVENLEGSGNALSGRVDTLETSVSCLETATGVNCSYTGSSLQSRIALIEMQLDLPPATSPLTMERPGIEFKAYQGDMVSISESGNAQLIAESGHAMLQASGDVNIIASDDVNISGSGNVDVAASGPLNLVSDSDVSLRSVTGDVSILSSGNIALLASGAVNLSVTAGVALVANELYLTATSGPFQAYANGGDATIESVDDDVVLCADQDGMSTGKINIKSGTSTTVGTQAGDIGLSASNSIILATENTDISLSAAGVIDAIANGALRAAGSTVDISSTSGDVNVEAAQGIGVTATNGDLSVVTESGNATLASESGDVNVNASGDVNINASGNINMSLGEGLGLSGTRIDITATDGPLNLVTESGTATLASESGDVNVFASGIVSVAGSSGIDVQTDGPLTLAGTTVDISSTSGDVNVEAAQGIGVTATNGDLNVVAESGTATLASESGDVNVNASGDVNINASGSVAVDSNQFHVTTNDIISISNKGSSIRIVSEGTSPTSLVGGIHIHASNNLDLKSETSNVNIAAKNNVNIDASSAVDIAAEGIFRAAGTTIDMSSTSGDINLEAAHGIGVTATNGDLNVVTESGNAILASESGDVNINASGDVNINASGNINMSLGEGLGLSGTRIDIKATDGPLNLVTESGTATLSSESGDVNVFASGIVSVAGSSGIDVQTDGPLTMAGTTVDISSTSGDLNVEAAQGIGVTATNGDLNVVTESGNAILASESGDVNISASGDVNISASGSINFSGDVSVPKVLGNPDALVAAANDVNVQASGAIFLSGSGNIDVQTDGPLTMAGTTVDISSIVGDLNILAAGDLAVTGNTVDISSVAGDLNLEAADGIRIKAINGNMNIAGSGAVNLDASSSVNINGKYALITTDDLMQISNRGSSMQIYTNGTSPVSTTGGIHIHASSQLDLKSEASSVNISASGDVNIDASSAIDIEAAGALRAVGTTVDISSIAGDLNLEAAQGIGVTATDGDLNVVTESGNATLASESGDVNINASGDVNISASGAINFSGDVTVPTVLGNPDALISAAGDVNVQASGALDIDVSGNVEVDSNRFYVTTNDIINISNKGSSIRIVSEGVPFSSNNGGIHVHASNDLDLKSETSNVNIAAKSNVNLDASSAIDIAAEGALRAAGTTVDISSTSGDLSLIAGNDLTINTESGMTTIIDSNVNNAANYNIAVGTGSIAADSSHTYSIGLAARNDLVMDCVLGTATLDDNTTAINGATSIKLRKAITDNQYALMILNQIKSPESNKKTIYFDSTLAFFSNNTAGLTTLDDLVVMATTSDKASITVQGTTINNITAANYPNLTLTTSGGSNEIDAHVVVNGFLRIDTDVTITGDLTVYGTLILASNKTLKVYGNVVIDGMGVVGSSVPYALIEGILDVGPPQAGDISGSYDRLANKARSLVIRNMNAPSILNGGVNITGRIVSTGSILFENNMGGTSNKHGVNIAATASSQPIIQAETDITFKGNIGGVSTSSSQASSGVYCEVVDGGSSDYVAIRANLGDILFQDNVGGYATSTGLGGHAVSLYSAGTAQYTLLQTILGDIVLDGNRGGESNTGRGGNAVYIRRSNTSPSYYLTAGGNIQFSNNSGGRGEGGGGDGAGVYVDNGGTQSNTFFAEKDIKIINNISGSGPGSSYFGYYARFATWKAHGDLICQGNVGKDGANGGSGGIGAAFQTNIAYAQNMKFINNEGGKGGDNAAGNGGTGGPGVYFFTTNDFTAFQDIWIVDNKGGKGGNSTSGATGGKGGYAVHVLETTANLTAYRDMYFIDNVGGAGGDGFNAGNGETAVFVNHTISAMRNMHFITNTSSPAGSGNTPLQPAYGVLLDDCDLICKALHAAARCTTDGIVSSGTFNVYDYYTGNTLTEIYKRDLNDTTPPYASPTCITAF